MDIGQITIYNVKSNRKNSKCSFKSYNVYQNYYKEYKRYFNDYDIMDLKQWINLQEYNYYRLVVYYNTENLHNWKTHIFTSKGTLIKRVSLFMNMINGLENNKEGLTNVKSY